jgi:hypothetical protein
MQAPQTPLPAASRRGAARPGEPTQPAGRRGSCASAGPARFPGAAATPPAALTRQFLAAGMPARPRDPSAGAKWQCAGSATRLPPPSPPAAQAPRREVDRQAERRGAADEREARGPLCGALRRLETDPVAPQRCCSAAAAPATAAAAAAAAEAVLPLLVVVVEAAAPPDGPSASHRLWVTDTHSRGGAETRRRAGPEGRTGVGPQLEAVTLRQKSSWEL